MSADETTKARAYHHGDLRRAVLQEALRAIAEEGPAAVSLRELARRVGVSHAAPAHHFRDKPGLLTAVAAEGFRLLAEGLRVTYERTESFLEVGVAYVRFATRHRPYFEVMFRPDLYRRDDPELVEASGRAAAMLYGPVGELTGEKADEDVLRAGVAAWALVHGLATLFVNGNLPARLGRDPEVIARAIAPYLFQGRQVEERRT
jgi:AcrR family transcriptional regulator